MSNPLPWTILVRPQLYWRAVRAGRLGARDLLLLAAFIAGVTAAYGAMMAGWRAPRLALYAAVKLPLVFLVTVAAVSVFNAMTAAAAGCAIRYRQTLFLAAGAMATASWLLLALLPVSLVFTLTGVPHAGSPAVLRYAHNCMLMTHVAVLATAGLAGNAVLLRGLRALAPTRARAAAVFAVWLAAYAFVGCQASWMLRPFVGSPSYPVAFVRPDACERNFYEFVFGEVLPFVMTGGDRP